MTDDELYRLLGQLRAFQHRQRAERPPVAGLSRSAIRVLGAVARSEPGTGAQPARLGRELVMTSSNVAAALRELTTQGLVERAPDAADTRRVNITLTAEGRRLVDESRAARDLWLHQAIRDVLTDADERTLLAAGDLIERLAAHQPATAGSHSRRRSDER